VSVAAPVTPLPAPRTPAEPSLVEAAAAASRIAADRPEEAVELSGRVERAALAAHDWAAVSMSRRARGVAEMHLRRLAPARVHLRAAVAAAHRAGDAVLAGEAHMSLASVLVLGGSARRGFAEIELALTMLSGLAAARARVQRAAILQELGRLDEALRDLRLALPALRRAGDAQWETRALSNRSLMFTTRRQFAAAEQDLLRAQRLCRTHALTLPGAYVEQNLGCVRADRGDVPAALQHFDAAGELYRRHGIEVGSLQLDRARVLLSVRLVAEARAAAEGAAATFGEQRRKVQLPEAQLLVSTSALLQGDHGTAAAAARSAAAAFARLGRADGVALARYAKLQALVGAAALDGELLDSQLEGRNRVEPAQLRRAAGELESAGWVVPALEARVLAGRLALARGQRPAARRDFAAAARMRRSGPADARARAWLGEALLRQATGSRRGARSALRAGLRIVDDHRATLGATELRAHVSVFRGALGRAGLRLALQEQDAHAVRWWAERGRASADELRPARPPEDPQLADHLAELRATMTEIEERRGSGASAAALVVRQVQLEHQIRDRTRVLGGGSVRAAAPPPTLPDLAASLGEVALVELVDLDQTLHAVTVVEGRVRLHALGDRAAVQHALTHLPFALHRLARSETRALQLEGARQVLERASAVFEAELLRPVAAAVGDRPLVVVPSGWLQSVPWSVLPSCVGRPVSVAPSVATWLAASRRPARPEAGVLVVAGPGLAGAALEAREVAGLHPGAELLEDGAATAAAVGEAMGRSRLVHVAAHGLLRADNPLFSALRLADGPFTVHDLERLAATPDQVVLAACSSAVSHVTAGEEILGLAAALLAQGTASLVAPVVPVPDVETRPLMTSFHAGLRAGLSPARALAEAQQRYRLDSPQARAGAAGFVCLGAGHSGGSG